MNQRIYADLPRIAYEGRASTDPLACRWGRRRSIAPVDLLEGHVGGMATLGRAFLCAAALHGSDELEQERLENIVNRFV